MRRDDPQTAEEGEGVFHVKFHMLHVDVGGCFLEGGWYYGYQMNKNFMSSTTVLRDIHGIS